MKTVAHAGVTIDNTPIVISAVFLLYNFIDSNVFAAILYAAILVMAYLHVAPFRMKKLGGRWYYAVTAYVVILTVAHASKIWDAIAAASDLAAQEYRPRHLEPAFPQKRSSSRSEASRSSSGAEATGPSVRTAPLATTKS